jgi:hypothetical protein
MRLGTIAAAYVALTPLASPAFAAQADDTPPLVHADDKAPGHPGMTYLDLMRIALPSLAINDNDNQIEGHLPKRAPRHLGGKTFEGPADDPVTLETMQDWRIRIGGHRRIALLADLGPKPETVAELELLILFDDEGPAPKVLDMADVGTDRYSGFAGRLSLGPGDDGLVTYSEHNDADITMGAYMIVSTIGDRLKMVDWFGATSENLCSWTGEEKARFATTPDPGRAYRRIAVTVSAEFHHTGEDGCNDEKLPTKGVRRFRASYRWNAATGRYEIARSQLPALAKLNDRFP